MLVDLNLYPKSAQKNHERSVPEYHLTCFRLGPWRQPVFGERSVRAVWESLDDPDLVVEAMQQAGAK